MASFLAWRVHLVHFVVFGVPVVGLVGAIGVQEIRGRRGAGHLDESRRRTARPRTTRRHPEPLSLSWASLGLVIAAAIHAAVIRAHFQEDLLYGLFFLLVTVVQLGLAVEIFLRPSQRMVRYVAAMSAWIIVLYVVSRVTGLPVGPTPWRPEAFGALDIAATGAELVTLVGCAVQLRNASMATRRFAQRLRGFTP
jgi:hypothetical protein